MIIIETIDLETIKKKKRSLKRYRKILSNVERLERKREDIDGKIKSIRTSNLSGMPRGGVPVTVEDLLCDIDELDGRIKRLKRKAKTYKQDILSEIDTLDDSRYADVLEYYFIDCLPLETIADKMNYTERYTYSLYKAAINELIKLDSNIGLTADL